MIRFNIIKSVKIACRQRPAASSLSSSGTGVGLCVFVGDSQRNLHPVGGCTAYYDTKSRKMDSDEFFCEVCQQGFLNFNQVQAHFIQVHSARMFRCTECDEVFFHHTQLEMHMIEDHMEANYDEENVAAANGDDNVAAAANGVDNVAAAAANGVDNFAADVNGVDNVAAAANGVANIATDVNGVANAAAANGVANVAVANGGPGHNFVATRGPENNIAAAGNVVVANREDRYIRALYRMADLTVIPTDDGGPPGRPLLIAASSLATTK
ncbi:hypothetical protein ACOSQ3_025191 [Xanthoceras sorbifolium]